MKTEIKHEDTENDAQTLSSIDVETPSDLCGIIS